MGHLLLLAPLVAVAFLTVRDDLREGKIFNKWVILGLASGAIAYALLWIAELAGAPAAMRSAAAAGGSTHWALVALLDAGVGLVCGIGLWLLGVWAAADAKLFTVYAFLIPPAVYSRSWLPSFPALPLLVNVFLLVFLYLVLDLLRTGVPAIIATLVDPAKRREASRRTPAALARLLPLVLILTAMFAGLRSMREVSREGLAPVLEVSEFTMFLILFAVFKPVSMMVKKRWGQVLFTVISLFALLYLGLEHGLEGIVGLVVPSASAVGLLVFGRAYQSAGEIAMKVIVGDLRPGMMIAAQSLASLRDREKMEMDALGEDAPEDAPAPGTTPVPPRLGEITVEGLTEEQVRYVRTRWKDDEPILIARTIPFSPFLAAGALVTWAAGGPLTKLL